MRTSLQHHAWICLVAGLVFFTNLGGPALWDRDEPRNAGCAVEMMERGDWVVPMFNNELRVHKPVLLYWFMMTAYAVFGVGEFAARVWSAIFGLGTMLATYHIGRRLFSAEVGFWSAIILSSCMMFPVAARAATPDAVLIFFTTLATLVYVYGAFPSHKHMEASSKRPATSALAYFPSSWWIAVLMYALMGVAMLAKGPVGLVLPTAVIGMFLLIVRLSPAASRDRQGEDAFVDWLGRLLRPFAPRHFLAVCWSMRPLTALGASLAVALPWYLWVGLRTEGEWLKGFFLVHHLQRATEPMEGHDGSFFYYVIAIVLSFFPWSLLLIPAIERTVERIRRRLSFWAPQAFVACWAAVYIVAFSLARTKLPNYVTPALPALALMTASFVANWRHRGEKASPYWFRMAFAALVVVGIGVSVGLVVAGGWFLSGDGWPALVGAIPIVGGIAGLRVLRRTQPRRAVGVFAVTAIALACALFGFVSMRVTRHQHCRELFAPMYARSPEPRIATFRCLEPSWVFYARRPIRSFSGDNPQEAIDFLLREDDGFLITTEQAWKTVSPLPLKETAVLASFPYFMRQEKLLVIGRAEKAGPAG